MDEPGWYTSEIGGIVGNGTNWSFWPLDDRLDEVGPWRTLKLAMAGAEAWHSALPNKEQETL
jgi:hypothetical protein